MKRQTTVKVTCPQCSMLSINGIPCHEIGCPNIGARWDSDTKNWVKQCKCFECGSIVDVDYICCSDLENLCGSSY